MNALTSTRITSPFNKTEECSKFTITDATDPFTLYGVAVTGKTQTFSFWIKAASSSTVTILDTECAAKTSWAKHAITFEASSKDISIYFNTAGTYYIFHPQLELGNQATDWNPAPEDVENAIEILRNDIQEEIETQRTEILSTSEKITLSALGSYAKSSSVESLRSDIYTELSVMAGEIRMEFEETSSEISGVNEEFAGKFQTLHNYITFTGENGITIGSDNNSITLEIDNDGIVFKRYGKQFGFWDGTDFYTGNIVVKLEERAQFGNFAYIPRSDGSLSFLKVGG